MASEGYYDVKHELFISISNLKVSMLETGGAEKKLCHLLSSGSRSVYVGMKEKP